MSVSRTLTRATTVSGGVCAALLLCAAPASAAPPFTPFSFPLPSSSPADAGEDGFCAFPVLVEGVAEFRSVPPGDPGSTRFVGPGFATVTNTQTGESVSFNISGPSNPRTSPAGVVTYKGTGGQLAFTTVGNSFPGVSPLTYSTGLLTFTIAADGTTTAYSAKGRTVDVCAALAP